MQMTVQLGPLPSALTPHSGPLTRAQGRPSQGRGPPAPCPSGPTALYSQLAHDSTSRQPHPTQPKSAAGSLRLQRGRLQLLHEAACPLHLELAKVDSSMASLVMAMLRYDPEQRVSAAEALQQPFLSALSPVLQLLAANREADDKPPQHRAVGSVGTQAQGLSQQACQAEAVVRDQAAGTLRSERPSGLPFKPEPRRQAFASLPFQDPPNVQAAVPAWAVNRLSMPCEPLLPATQPQLQAAQPQLQASQPQLQAAQPQLHISRPQLQSSQPQLQQPPQGTLSPLTAQIPITSPPTRTADMTAADVLGPATATTQLPAVASATQRHNPPEVTAHGSSSKDLHLPTVLPEAVPSLGPLPEQAVPLLASQRIAACTLPAEQADPPSPRHVEQVAGAGAVETPLVPGQTPVQASGLAGAGAAGTLLAVGQGPVKTPGLAGAGAVATPTALGPGPVKTPGLVKAWKGVTELLQQMSPASQVQALLQAVVQSIALCFALCSTASCDVQPSLL